MYTEKFLTWKQVLKQVKYALDYRKPFSLVRIGDGENICLAQNSVWPIRDVLKEPWTKKANRGEKGVHLPNIRLRNELVQGIRNANVVGVLLLNDNRIHAPKRLKRILTNKIFTHFNLSPRYTCDACINRYIPKYKAFWDVLKNRRVLLISQHANEMKQVLVNKYDLNVTGTLFFSDYRQINRVLKEVDMLKNKFDLVLISAGVNAVILAPKIARRTGKVAIDFGQGHKNFMKSRTV
ncbi:GT-D fold domain-containing glycosyltransferase [Paenibacillus glycanilyticus]|uniref:GT-D fold domain-containing glycosyltransferase n=1 Tax=Paenibacillus glycanilyticus TaxID=126569 RepID=UPI000FDA2CD0|nr:GT-D fold domain-containing glycosyltransferase [Paenibacillus glycanilyticus]